MSVSAHYECNIFSSGPVVDRLICCSIDNQIGIELEPVLVRVI